MARFKGGTSMERLTERGEDGKYFVRISRDSDLIIGAEERLSPGLEKWTGWWEHTVLGNIVDRLAAYEDTGLAPVEVHQMRWIPVEERLPKPQENPVIACDYTGVCLAWYSPTMGWQYRTGLSGVDITHWMPLPQPPKEEAYEK